MKEKQCCINIQPPFHGGTTVTCPNVVGRTSLNGKGWRRVRGAVSLKLKRIERPPTKIPNFIKFVKRRDGYYSISREAAPSPRDVIT